MTGQLRASKEERIFSPIRNRRAREAAIWSASKFGELRTRGRSCDNHRAHLRSRLGLRVQGSRKAQREFQRLDPSGRLPNY
ncbi:hypothetical protein PMAYCL1PPCAC_22607 [Pristionchus mayeri]|uniref:Uncharacterized protein n=1 Tax=Pristionchus mayeri TaxID=1317129 RepID=A0AAN5CXS0_9BILA|nr:hypothetical protein PMAYCL1PPCAC_22607 [Pristionchus mayeri]